MIQVIRHQSRKPPVGDYKLTEEDKDHIAILVHLDLWSNTRLGEVFGVDRRMIRKATEHREVIDSQAL